jgi:hypothetical protein
MWMELGRVDEQVLQDGEWQQQQECCGGGGDEEYEKQKQPQLRRRGGAGLARGVGKFCQIDRWMYKGSE